MKKILLVLICFLFVVGCAPQKNPTPAGKITDAPVLPTNTALPTETQSPTATSTPTATPLPLATATLSFPLTNGTPLPPSTTPITSENVANLRQLLLWSQNPTGQQLFSPDGSLLLYATSEWLHIYDVKSKTLIAEISDFIAPSNQSGTLAISEDNQRIMLMQNSIVKIIDPLGKEVLSVAAAGQAALSPDGKLVAVLDYCKYTGQIQPVCEVSVYEINSGEKITSFPGELSRFTPDSKNLILKQGNFLYFRQLSDGKMIRQFDPDNYLNDLVSWSLSPDGSVFISMHDRATRAVVYENGKEGYENLPLTIDLVSVKDGKLLAQFVEFAQSVYISKNNQYFAIVDYDKVHIYDITKKESFYEGVIPNNHYVSDIQGVNDDGTLFYVIHASEIIGFNEPITWTHNLEWKEDALHFDTLSAYDNQGRYCQIKQSGNAECSPLMTSFLASDGNYYDVQVDPEFITLLKVTGETAETVTQVNWKDQAFNNVSSGSIVGYSPENNFLVLQIHIGSNTSRVISVDLTKNQITNNWDWDEVRSDMAIMSPSANFMALKISGHNYGDEKPRWEEGVYDFTKGWFVWHGGDKSSYLLRFSPDEKYLMEVQSRYSEVGEVSIVFIYDFIERKQVTFYEMQRDFSGEFGACFVNDAEISPDDSMAFFACEDGTIQVADLLTGKNITRWKAFNEPVSEISISADSTRLTAGAGGLIKVWDVP